MKYATNVLFLLATALSLYYVLRGRYDKALLGAYLPLLILLPDYYNVRLPHLPPFSAAQAALVPLGLAALFRSLFKGPYSRLDAWVVLFMISLAISETTRELSTNDGIFMTITAFISMFLAYVVGRRLIEPSLRMETVKRIVVCLLLMAPLGAYELRMGENPYAILGRTLQLESVTWGVQYRAGHARMSLSLSDAELAGIVFAVALCLNAWLLEIYKNDRMSGSMPRLGSWFNKLQQRHIPTLLLLGFLFLTHSRGPLLAGLFGFAIFQVTRFKDTRRGTLVMGSLLLFLSIVLYAFFVHYTAGPFTTGGGAENEQKESAQYRAQLLTSYAPILDEGGWLGWGLLSHPSVPGLGSIDNEFLLVQLGQGRLGLILFVIIAIESLVHLVGCTWRFQNREDKVFAFALLAALAIFWISILTVFMGEQLPQIGFLLLGWSQSIQDGTTRSTTGAALSDSSMLKYRFKRVFS